MRAADLSRHSSLFLAITLLAQAAYSSSGYIGSKTCFGCHENIYRSFVKTGMGCSMQLVAALDTSTFPSEFVVSTGSIGRVLRVYRDQTGWHQSETEPNVFVEEHTIDYAVGAGANGFTFLVRRGNYLFQAPLSFYTKAGKWDLSPGYESVDLGFTRPAPEACIACHSGRSRPVPHRTGEYLDPPFDELAIGCENCHGPGANHVKTLGRVAGAIVNPAKLPARLAEDICMNCHQRGDTRILQPGKTYADFRPGQPLFNTLAIFRVPDAGAQQNQDLLEHDSAMKASRCFRASGGKLSCLTCHDPHVQPAGRQAVSFYRAKCSICHTDASCKLPLSVRAAKNPADDCTGCHMPKRDVAVISHSALTNHRIPASSASTFHDAAAPDPATGLVLLDPPFDRQQIVPDLTLLRAYAELAPRYPAFQSRYLDLLGRLSQTEPNDPFVEAALGHKLLAEGKNEEALSHLSRAVSMEDTTVYLDLAKASSNLGRGGDALAYLKHAVEIDPYNPALQKTLILEYINLKRYPDARQAMQEYVKSFPGDTFMRGMLARVSN